MKPDAAGNMALTLLESSSTACTHTNIGGQIQYHKMVEFSFGEQSNLSWAKMLLDRCWSDRGSLLRAGKIILRDEREVSNHEVLGTLLLLSYTGFRVGRFRDDVQEESILWLQKLEVV